MVSAYVIPPLKREEHFGEFIKRLQIRGVDTSAISIAQFETEGYGLKAEKDLAVSLVTLILPNFDVTLLCNIILL